MTDPTYQIDVGAMMTRKPIIESPDILVRIEGAKDRLRDGHALMRIPVDPTDPDCVLADAELEIKRLRALLSASKPAVALEDELASMTRMFHAACSDLGLVNEALGLDHDDAGAAPILEAIAELKSARDQWVDANYAAPAQPCGEDAANGATGEREAFEAWYRKEIHDVTMYRRDVKGSERYGEYCQWFHEESWKAWQARAASPAASSNRCWNCGAQLQR